MKKSILLFIAALVFFCLIMLLNQGKRPESFSTVPENETVSFGHYEQDNDRSNGLERIEWIILDKTDDAMLLLSRYGLDAKPFHDRYEEVSWEDCSLRKWLNEDFLKEAFTPEEQKKIVKKDPADDRLFFLSIPEVEKAFPSVDTRKCKPTDYAVASGAYLHPSVGGWWWLRSVGQNAYAAAYVYKDIVPEGFDVTAKIGSVRPALWIGL